MKYSRFPFMAFLVIGLCLFIFPELPLLLPQDALIDGMLRENTEFIKEENLLKAWNNYKKLLENKDQDLTHIVTEVSPGYYKNVQEVILKKMAEILEKPTLPEEIKIEVDTFFTNLKTPEKSDIKKVRSYLPSIKGFKLFQKFGENYLEEGDCTQAILLWEEAQDISLGYKHLDRGDKALFLTQLGYCYKQLGLNDKLKALFNENPDLKKAGTLLNSTLNIPFKKELLSSLGTVAQALKELNSYAQTCPVDFESTASEKDLIIQYSKEGHEFISKPITLHNKVYILSKNERNAIFLLTLNKNTGTLLNEQYIEESRVAHVYLKNGKINIVTPFAFYKINLNGAIAIAVDMRDGNLKHGTEHEEWQKYHPLLGDQLVKLALSEKDLEERRRIFVTLKNMGGRVIPHLVQSRIAEFIRISERDLEEAKVDDIEKLRSMGPFAQSAVPQLVEHALLNPEWKMRNSAQWILANLWNETDMGIPIFKNKLSDPDEKIRAHAATALGKIGERADAVIELKRNLTDLDENVRVETIRALGNMGPKAHKAIPVLIYRLSDPNNEVRAEAANVLGSMGESAEEAIPDLILASSEDEDSHVRFYATSALEEMGEKDHRAIPMLIKKLTSNTEKDLHVRQQAVYALGKMKSETSSRIGALIEALTDHDISVRMSVKAVLRNDIGIEVLSEYKNSKDYKDLGEFQKSNFDDVLDSLKTDPAN